MPTQRNAHCLLSTGTGQSPCVPRPLLLQRTTSPSVIPLKRLDIPTITSARRARRQHIEVMQHSMQEGDETAMLRATNHGKERVWPLQWTAGMMTDMFIFTLLSAFVDVFVGIYNPLHEAPVPEERADILATTPLEEWNTHIRQYVRLEEWNTSPSHFSLLGTARGGEWILQSAER